MPSPYYPFMSLTGRGHDTFVCRITCKKAGIWTFFWLDRKQYGWFALFQLAKMPPSVSCWFQSAFLLASWAVTSSETQGQSVGSGEKARRKFSSKGGRAPGYRLSPDHFQKFKPMPAPDWAQKMLCIIVPNRWAHLLSSFRVFVHDGYCTACRGHAPKKCTQSGNFQFDIDFPYDFKILSARKLKTLFQKKSFSLQQVFTLASATSCVNTFIESI